MNQSAATKLVSKLRFKINERKKLHNPDGPIGRHNKIRKTVTALFKYERLEMGYFLADETRGYAERLISDAIRYGDCHKETMEMASYWIIEKPVIHKLFKVLAPRYQNHNFFYTKIWKAPTQFPGDGQKMCVLELCNNIYPSLAPPTADNKNLIHNVLLEAAREEYSRNKAKKEAQMAAAAAQSTQSVDTETVVEGSEIKETSGAGDNNSDKMSMTERESDPSPEENLKADSDSRSESIEKSEVNTSEIEADLNKMDIKEGKEAEAEGETEKK